MHIAVAKISHRDARMLGAKAREAANAEPDRFAVLNATLARINAQAQAGRFTSPVPMLQPVKPWHILAKQAAMDALVVLRLMRTRPHLCCWERSMEQQRAYADSWVKAAIRANLFAKGLTPSQTFGSALKVVA